MEKKDTKDFGMIFSTLLNEYFNVVILVSAVLILIFGFFFIINPKRIAIVKDSNETKNEKLVIKDELENLKKEISLYERGYKAISETNKKKINTMLPSESETGNLMIQLEELIKKKGLFFKSLTVTSRAEKKVKNSRTASNDLTEDLPEGVGAVDIALELEGINYKALKDLLSEFENNLRLMDVISLDFSPNSSNLTLDIVTYYNK